MDKRHCAALWPGNRSNKILAPWSLGAPPVLRRSVDMALFRDQTAPTQMSETGATARQVRAEKKAGA